MIKKFIVVFLVLFLVTGSVIAEEKKFGVELTLTDVTKVSEILDNPEDFVGKTVLVEGTIVGVCEKRGCWMEIAGDKPFTKIKGKVNDGEIVFPMEAMGETARLEGEFQKMVLSVEQVTEMKKHEAEEHGTEFNPEDVKGPETYYQIKVTGAVIK